jgi:hypothetical protein
MVTHSRGPPLKGSAYLNNLNPHPQGGIHAHAAYAHQRPVGRFLITRAFAQI